MSQIDVAKLTQRTVGKLFPHVLIKSPTQCLPVIVKSLEKGDTQLIVELNGQRKCVINMSLSAFNIDKLLRCCGDIYYVKEECNEEQIMTISQYLELVVS